MLVSGLLRDARRRSGLSLRAAALRCGVPRATWAGWESGATRPSAARLGDVLAGLGLELQLVPRSTEPPGEELVRRHLTRSLTSRLQLALGDQLHAVLGACYDVPRRIGGPAAVGVWVPHVVARGPLPLPPADRDPALVPVQLSARAQATAWVPPPSVLLSEGKAEQWPALRTSCRLLVAHRATDAADRQLPPHRDADETREVLDLAQTLTWGGRSRFPISPTDSRSWRLGAPATLDEALERQGLPPRNRRA